MIEILKLAIFLVFCNGHFESVSSQSHLDKNLDLLSVHVVVRHGARTPATNAYPTDPYVDETYEPFGFGEMTNVGRREVYDVGKFLRNRYDKFLGKDLKLSELYAESTELSRAKMTVQLVLAGLYPPRNTAFWWEPNLNWQPIGANYIKYTEDNLLLATKSCPRSDQLFKDALFGDFSKDVQTSAKFYKDLTEYTGIQFWTPLQVLSVYSTLKSQEELGFKLPQWVANIDQKVFDDQYAKSFMYFVHNDEMKKLRGGMFAKRMVGEWDKKVSGVKIPKMFVYGAHDLSVVQILSAFNVWEKQVPAYGITAIFELTQHKITKQYGVEVYLRNSTTVEPYKLQIKGCTEYCYLDQVKTLLSSHIPLNWDAECKAV